MVALVLAAVLVLTGLGLLGARVNRGRPVSPVTTRPDALAGSRARTASTTQPELALFESQEGRFRARMPWPVHREEQAIPSPSGPVAFIRFGPAESALAAPAVHVGFSDFSALDQVDHQAVFDASAQAVATTLKGTIVSRTFMQVAGDDAQDLVIDIPNDGGTYRQRILLHGHRFYQLSGASPKGAPFPAYDELIASFEVLPD